MQRLRKERSRSVELAFSQAIRFAAIGISAEDKSRVDPTLYTQVFEKVGEDALERAKCRCGRLDSLVIDYGRSQ